MLLLKQVSVNTFSVLMGNKNMVIGPVVVAFTMISSN